MGWQNVYALSFCMEKSKKSINSEMGLLKSHPENSKLIEPR